MSAAELTACRVVYAYPDRQVEVALELAPGASVAEAIERSGILGIFPEIDLAVQPVGVYGRPVHLSELVRPDDRIEIYRPLRVEPRARRRREAASTRSGRARR